MTTDCDWDADTAQKILEPDFRIEEHLGHQFEKGGEFRLLGHFMADANRASPHGLGGDAHSHWVAGVFRDGVYVYADNYAVTISFTSTPDAQVTPGCQDSRVHASPRPTVVDGKWLSPFATDVPDAVREKVLAIANAILREAAECVLVKAREAAANKQVARDNQSQEHDDQMRAWEEYQKENTDVGA